MTNTTPTSGERASHGREYQAEGIVVTWDPHLCQHATECVRGLPSVFNSKARPWINPAGADVEELVAVIDRCPSFALGYRTNDGRVRVSPSEAQEPQ